MKNWKSLGTARSLLALVIALIGFVSLFVVAPAQAEPRDGDTIVFVGYRGDDATKLTLREVASITKFNVEADECTFTSTMYEFGVQISQSIQTLKISNVFSEEKGQKFIDECEKNKGVREELRTPAGIFQSCLLKLGSLSGGESLFNITPTPLATGKYVEELEDGTKMTMTLVDIKRGHE